MNATRGTARTIAIAGGIGAVSGVFSFIVPETLQLAGVDGGNSVVAWLLRLWPGIVFGVAIGLLLKRAGLTTTVRAAVFVVFDTAAWYAALWFAINGADKLGFPFKTLVPVGVASGLIGAGLVALSALILFPVFRRWKPVAAMIAAGGAAGLLLGFGAEGFALLVLFVVWQGAVAACFGWGVARTRED